MKNVAKISTIILVSALIAMLCWIPNAAVAQVSVFGNNPTGGAYLGWNGAQDLDFKTNNILRMQLMETQTSTINGWPGIVQSGHLGLSDELGLFSGIGAASMIHINGGNSGAPHVNGFRPWMKYGMLVTSNKDLMYVGHKADSLDKTDAVISWADNGSSSHVGPDNLRFIFTGEQNYGGESTSHLEGGQEVMRISPAPEANMGVGNFSANGLAESPTQRIDVDGTARLRRMNMATDVLITGKEQNGEGDYVLTYLGFPGDESVVLNGSGEWSALNAFDCRWKDIGSPTIPGELEIYTGVDPESDCYRGKVGVGIKYMKSKLAVVNKLERDNVLTATYSRSTGVGTSMGSSVIGVHGYADSGSIPGSAFINNGVLGVGAESRYAVGVRGKGLAHYSGSTTGVSFGVMGEASGAMSVNAAIYGEVTSAADYSGYFVGGLFTMTGFPVTISDESVKNTIQEIEGASDILSQLQPKTYYYQSPSNREIAFHTDLQYGFVAQEVQEILPDIVQEVTVPEQTDSTGFIEGTSVDLLGIQYESLIPILVAAFKEQQVQVTEQAQAIDDLQQSLNNQNDLIAQMMGQMAALGNQISDCCEGGFKYNPMDGGHGNLNNKPVPNGNVLEQNVPNPFRSQTTISYKLEQGGKVMLNIFDRNGKPLATLVEAEQQAGTYRYQWDASGLPAGVYNYALYVDGELLVKKAIKLAD